MSRTANMELVEKLSSIIERIHNEDLDVEAFEYRIRDKPNQDGYVEVDLKLNIKDF